MAQSLAQPSSLGFAWRMAQSLAQPSPVGFSPLLNKAERPLTGPFFIELQLARGGQE